MLLKNNKGGVLYIIRNIIRVNPNRGWGIVKCI